MARTIITGAAGSRYTNNTGQVLYQFHCALINTCGRCLQYYLKISTSWPIPLHRNCRCWAVRLDPGSTASHGFADFGLILSKMSSADRATAIGASNARLLDSGLATLDDIVTPYRVRDFAEVVARTGLSIKAMTKAGVAVWIAKRAYETAHESEDEARARHDRELVDRLAEPDRSQANLVAALSAASGGARRLAGRGRSRDPRGASGGVATEAEKARAQEV